MDLLRYATAVIKALLALAFAPVWLPLFALRWAYLVVRGSQGNVEYAIKIVGASCEEVWFLLTHAVPGIKMMLEHRKVTSEVYASFKGREMMLDVHNSDGEDVRARPVVVFVYGGTWSSGGRWMYAPVAKRLATELDATVVVPDYLYYPHASMVEMAAQLAKVDDYVRQRFAEAPAVWWCGHSAGAHLIMLYHLRMHVDDVPHDAVHSTSTPVEHTPAAAGRSVSPMPVGGAAPPRACEVATKLRSVNEREPFKIWPIAYSMTGGGGREEASSPVPHDVPFRKLPPGTRPAAGLVLLSGVYDIRHHLEYETARGVHLFSSMKNATFGHFETNSPSCILEQLIDTHTADELRTSLAAFPKVLVCHGAQDLTVSHGQGAQLHWLLKTAGVASTLEHRLKLTHVSIVTHLWDAGVASPLLPVMKTFINGA